jgi:hypothetical protein
MLYQRLGNLKKGTTQTITQYYGRAIDIQLELQVGGDKVSYDRLNFALLAGLPAAFNYVVSNLEGQIGIMKQSVKG